MKNTIRTIIVEDEERNMKFLERLVLEFCPEVKVIGTAENVDIAFSLIAQNKPDLVFLDIELKSATAFQLLQKFDKVEFSIIFTTAYEQYALQAIKSSAIDYLLKPIDPQELIISVNKLKEKHINNTNEFSALEVLMHNLKSEQVNQHQIAISTNTGLHIVKFNDIIYLESDGPYTTFYLKNATKIVSSKNLKTFEPILPETMFYRSHNSYIINVNEMIKYIKSDGGQIVMSNQAILNVSKFRKDELLQKLNIV
jgi:two-component system LytT family response regulator